MRSVAIVLCALAFLASERVSADSSLFNPYAKDAAPDFVFTNGALNFTDAGGLLTIDSAFSGGLNYPDQTLNAVTGGSGGFGELHLNATIPNTGLNPDLTGQAITGSLNIIGKVNSLGFNGPNLLTGNLFAFRASPVGTQSTMEFLFNIISGDAAGIFNLSGTGVGIVVVSGVNLSGQNFTFKQDFSDTFVLSDTASTTAVPEPTSFVLSILGVVGVLAVARLRRNRRQAFHNIARMSA